jgi:hypothetical protein
MSKLRIGLPTSLECRPLTRAFVIGQFAGRYDAAPFPPGRIGPLLADGVLDLGVVTPFDLPALAALDMIPDIGAAFVAGSPTLRLVADGPLEGVHRLSTAGAGSFAVEVARRVLRREASEPALEVDAEPAGGAGVARLLEGVAGLADENAGSDLALLWRQKSGLPLVVGVWVVQRSIGIEEVLFDLKSSLRYGMAQLQTLARELASEVGADRRRLERLFRDDMHYVLGPQEQRAIASMVAP